MDRRPWRWTPWEDEIPGYTLPSRDGRGGNTGKVRADRRQRSTRADGRASGLGGRFEMPCRPPRTPPPTGPPPPPTKNFLGSLPGVAGVPPFPGLTSLRRRLQEPPHTLPSVTTGPSGDLGLFSVAVHSRLPSSLHPQDRTLPRSSTRPHTHLPGPWTESSTR